MNVVLLADKKIRKSFETAVKKEPTINLIGVEMVIRGNTMSRIADFHNPHVLVVFKDVPEKDGITVTDCISFLRVRKPNMRIVYVYGEVKELSDFVSTAQVLMESGINDIITETDYEKFIYTLNNPMTAEDVQELIEELSKEDEVTVTEVTAAEKSLPEQDYEELQIDFPSLTAIDKFDMDRIAYEVTQQSSKEHLTIGLAQLQHHLGCTHTAFEIAATLSKKMTTAVILADEGTFEALSVFHKINPIAAKKGLNFNGIDVFPYELRTVAEQEYEIVVYDYSFLREEKRKSFDNCDVRLMMSSAAEWDIAKVINFIKYNDESYVRNINFLFPRVTQSKFLKYSKALKKSGINAYRLYDSPDWTVPTSENTTVYSRIIENYDIIKSGKQTRKKLLRIK